jgi:hypothetical protein
MKTTFACPGKGRFLFPSLRKLWEVEENGPEVLQYPEDKGGKKKHGLVDDT